MFGQVFLKNSPAEKLKSGKNTEKCERSLKCWEYYRKKIGAKSFHLGMGGRAEKIVSPNLPNDIG